MRNLLTVILVLAVLVAAVAGCGGAHRYDARLAAADSLMQAAPDSALAIIEAVCRDSLADEGDRAYRDLLLTQARYRNYITATSDSDINRALAWYRAHSGEREKLTRSLIYKGAVMEELNHPDSAMLYYKQAEVEADETDYANLGFINMRIASLYRIYHVDFQKCYDKYGVALKYYTLTGDKSKQQRCIYNMSVCASVMHAPDAIKLMRNALERATELNDSSCQYECKEYLCRLLLSDASPHKEPKSFAYDCIYNYGKYLNQDLLLDLAEIYSRENNQDSALYFIRLVDAQPCTDSNHLEQIQYRRNDILSRIAGDIGDLNMYRKASDSAARASDQIHNRNIKHVIQSIEYQYERASVQKTNQKNHILRITLCASSVLFIILLTILICLGLRKLNRYEALIREVRENGMNAHEDLKQLINDKNSEIAHFVTSLVELIRADLQSETAAQKLSADNRIRMLVRQTTNDDFWQELKAIIDKSYQGIISNISKKNRIRQSDLRFICLVCCGFSPAEIAFIMDYSPKYISSKRKSIAKKLGLSVPLQSYLEVQKSKQQQEDY